MVKPRLIFYDIRTLIPGLPISPNTWRVRLVLNYKNIPYETVWNEGHGIDTTCIAAGIPPLEKREDGTPRYTLPALADLTDPEAPVRLCDSRKIIEYLEATYPSPEPHRALFAPGTHGLQLLADNFVDRIVQPPLIPLVIYQSVQKQPEYVRPHFEKYAAPGKTIAETELRGKEREEGWIRVRNELDKLSAYADGEVFFTGDNLRYIDIHVLAALVVVKLSIGEEEFEKELGPSAAGRWVKLVKTCTELIR